jgi:hypothetical protein
MGPEDKFAKVEKGTKLPSVVTEFAVTEISLFSVLEMLLQRYGPFY